MDPTTPVDWWNKDLQQYERQHTTSGATHKSGSFALSQQIRLQNWKENRKIKVAIFWIGFKDIKASWIFTVKIDV